MARITGSNPIKKSKGKVLSADPTGYSLSTFGGDSQSMMDNIKRADRISTAIANGERPSNLWYKVTNRTTFWHMYELMDLYRSEVSVFSTIINRSTTELLRYGVDLRAKFAQKCVDCGYESQDLIDECPICHSARLRFPDVNQKSYFRRPNGKSFLDEANDNGQSLKDVLKAYTEMQFQNNQGYTLCVTGDIINKEDASLVRAYPLEFIPIDPRFTRYLYDDTGRPGTKYAFTRDDRHTLIDLDQESDALNDATEEGKVLYPAAWQIGDNPGGTGNRWLYTSDEIYQDHWFRQSLIYGIPIGYDIEDDLLTYHYIEKHNLKKYKFGYVRKMVILPGFTDEDVEDIVKGVQDVLATNDNSIPIICTPPQMPGTAEMKAQTLELGTESSSDLMQIKNDIRDRLCAHWGVPNLFAGDVEASGGMNNESQQITVFDRYLMDKYEYLDRQCKWIMSWFPKITDWELVVNRPSKAYTDTKKRVDKLQEAQMMKGLGFQVKRIGGDFRYSEVPMDVQQMEAQQNSQQGGPMGAPQDMKGSLIPGDGEGPPDKGTLRREDEEVAGSKDEVDLSARDSLDAVVP